MRSRRQKVSVDIAGPQCCALAHTFSLRRPSQLTKPGSFEPDPDGIAARYYIGLRCNHQIFPGPFLPGINPAPNHEAASSAHHLLQVVL